MDHLESLLKTDSVVPLSEILTQESWGEEGEPAFLISCLGYSYIVITVETTVIESVCEIPKS